MNITVIKGDTVTTSLWSGGISKQYYIFPSTSSYAARDFFFRLSMAVASSDAEANYSNLLNITRHLIMIEGTSHVFHKGHYDIVMNPYTEIDVFDGGWESSGSGKVTDFNMMLAKGTHGKMSVVDKNGIAAVGGSCETCHKPYNRTAFLCGSGSASFAFSTGESLSISKGDMLLAEDIAPDINVNITLSDSKLVRMDVCCY